MTTAQAMEEELQQSVLQSEDANWETNEGGSDHFNTNTAHGSANGTIFIAPNGIIRAQSAVQEDPASERDASVDEMEVDEEEDASGEEDLDLIQETRENTSAPTHESNQHSQSDNELEDEDASGEDEEEAVGAVKIQPSSVVGDDVDEDDESDVSDAPSVEDDQDSDEEEEEEGVWEDARDMAGGEDEEDDSDTGPSNVCMFCKQDEDNDPSEDFEAYLACVSCGENAHQQCAREEAAMTEDNNAKKWKCPECYTGESDAENIEDDEAAEDDEDARPTSQQSDVPRMARDLLAVPIGSDDGDAHSVFNELVLQEDPGDGSRLLRKRKTSSIEPDDAAIPARKRRRNASLGTNHDDEAAESVNPSETGGVRSARASRIKAPPPAPVTVEKKTRTALVLKIHVRPGNLKEILGRKKRGSRKVAGGSAARTPKRPNNATPARVNVPPIPPLIETPFAAESYAQPYYSFFDRDTDDAKGKPYGGILADAEADTSKTLPATDDRSRFDQAKQKAEEEWRARVLAMQAAAEAPSRKHKRIADHASQIESIEFGGWEIDTWYAAPYPAEYSRNRVLYICEFCLKYMNSDYVAWRHKLKCATKHPPGDEIYRDGSVSMFEVDGRKNPEYCQNLCLLAKLFLGSKTLYYDVEPFLFYVLCEFDECGYHFVGYFSKEKRSSSQNNVSCILTLPIHQRKGYGNLLIDFSYLLTRVEEKTGSPEKPLSDMGLVSYRNYWRLVICQTFVNAVGSPDYKQEGLSIDQISRQTGLTQDDVISALEGLRALVRDPQTKTYAFRVDIDYCRDYVAKWQAKGYVKLKPDKLAWTPYIMGRGIATQFDLGPISTIAPREDEEAKVVEGPDSVGAETHPIINGVKEKDLAPDQVEPTTEGENGTEQSEAATSEETPKSGEEDKENTSPEDMNGDQLDDESVDSNWRLAYEGILPSRFEIFPSVTGGRRADRSRQSVSRPSLPRAPSSITRPKLKRPSSSSARRPSVPKPKSSSSRRKTGGTGRGPGRWPKGTKKADYGNADSGPGFPPGWSGGKGKGEDGDVEMMHLMSMEGGEMPPRDEVQVYVADTEPNGEASKENGEEQML